MKRKEYLAVFDLDGTLFDTTQVNYYSYQEALWPYGIRLEKKYFMERCNGRHYTEFLPGLAGAGTDLEKIHAAKKAAYGKYLGKAGVNRHLLRIIRALQDSYHTAVVTTASRENTCEILEYFGYAEMFELLVTQEDIRRTKPDPEGFIRAMKYFGMDARHTVIFEDSDVGIAAARASGADVFVVDTFGGEYGCV